MKLPVGVAGVGRWGKNIVRALERSSDFELVAVAEPRNVGLGVPRFESLSALLSLHQLSAVVIATPPASHAELARLALSRGVNALVEKPMCTSRIEAEQLRQDMLGANARLMVGHLLLFHPAVRGLERLIEHGRVGNVLRVQVERWSQAGQDPERCPWWTLAPHDLAVLLRWFGVPLALQLSEQSSGQILARLRYAAGVTAELSLFTKAAEKRRRMSLTGSLGSAVFDDLASHKLVLLEAGHARPVAISSEAPLDLELKHFAQGLRSGGRFDADVEQGAVVVEILTRGQQSLDHGGAWIPCAPEVARYGS
ncbi:MAG TPA: Gfo/Idh/MocA family oxidoreductase [Polyangiaceae bacterium]|nr:Gfo/Idh/MocA family oxidoreductase [Polyangiaceae bacterium]